MHGKAGIKGENTYNRQEPSDTTLGYVPGLVRNYEEYVRENLADSLIRWNLEEFLGRLEYVGKRKLTDIMETERIEKMMRNSGITNDNIKYAMRNMKIYK